jgi:hypothetical protein
MLPRKRRYNSPLVRSMPGSNECVGVFGADCVGPQDKKSRPDWSGQAAQRQAGRGPAGPGRSDPQATDLDDAKREIDLTIQKQVQAELTAVRDQAKRETEVALGLRVREKEEQIASMRPLSAE